uniref:Uncharacterized protein n=1 Tax=Oryza brachyantha TaxID=4533 RepID=J3MFB3_ORYBR
MDAGGRSGLRPAVTVWFLVTTIRHAAVQIVFVLSDKFYSFYIKTPKVHMLSCLHFHHHFV